MQDKSINGALLALRKQIIRGKLDGLEHVEALLVMRGVHMPRVAPPKKPDVALTGMMRIWVKEALSDGPKERGELVSYIARCRPDLPPQDVYRRTDRALTKMRIAGLVRREGRVWRLA